VFARAWTVAVAAAAIVAGTALPASAAVFTTSDPFQVAQAMVNPGTPVLVPLWVISRRNTTGAAGAT
jgi:hypothetical protein